MSAPDQAATEDKMRANMSIDRQAPAQKKKKKKRKEKAHGNWHAIQKRCTKDPWGVSASEIATSLDQIHEMFSQNAKPSNPNIQRGDSQHDPAIMLDASHPER